MFSQRCFLVATTLAGGFMSHLKGSFSSNRLVESPRYLTWCQNCIVSRWYGGIVGGFLVMVVPVWRTVDGLLYFSSKTSARMWTLLSSPLMTTITMWQQHTTGWPRFLVDDESTLCFVYWWNISTISMTLLIRLTKEKLLPHLWVGCDTKIQFQKLKWIVKKNRHLLNMAWQIKNTPTCILPSSECLHNEFKPISSDSTYLC